MKKLIVMVGMVASTFSIYGQKIVGVYTSEVSYSQNKYNLEINVNNITKIHVNELFNSNYLVISTQDSSYQIAKDSVFAFVKNNGVKYRLFKGEEYEIINSNQPITLYKKIHRVLNHNKGVTYQTRYFFSLANSTEISPLTLTDLKSKCAGQYDNFISYVELYFRHDGELFEYDHTHKKHKINHLFDIHAKNK